MDLMQLFHIPDRTINLIFVEVLAAIARNFSAPGIPTSLAACRSLARSMKDSRPVRSPWHGCIGAIDGIAIKILKPREEELPRNFRSRKGFFALPLQCVVDGKYRILCFSLRCAGSTHDNMLFDVSNLSAMLLAGHIPFEFWIVGDEAYICMEQLITPYPGTVATPGSDESTFNYFLSSLRVHVEQAFGILVARWAILQTTLSYSIEVSMSVIRAAILLHNFCVEQSDSYFATPRSAATTEEENDEWRQWLATSMKVFDEVEGRHNGLVSLHQEVREVSVRRRETVRSVRHLRRPLPRRRNISIN